MQVLRKILKRIEVTILYVLGLIRSLFSKSKYNIKRGYIHRSEYVLFDDTGLKDEYQRQVYELARFYLDKHKYHDVLDIGCGSGYKLVHYFSDCNTIGVEVDPNYEYLVNTYPYRNWIHASQTNNFPKKADIIICADVIEHLPNPNELIESIKKIDFELLFLSTPERSMVRGWYDYGPPENQCHIREWNAREFKRYISNYFDVIAHQITDMENATQLVICRKKRNNNSIV